MTSRTEIGSRGLQLWKCGITAVLIVTIFCVFGPALHSDLVNVDDDQVIGINPYIRTLGPEQLVWMATTKWMGQYHPLTWFSYALDFVWFGGSPRVLHTTNLVVHALTAVALFLGTASLFRFGRRPSNQGAHPQKNELGAVLAAGLAALLFALHPLRVEPVAWVTGRNDVLAALFLTLSFWTWCRFTQAQPALAAPPAEGVWRLWTLAIAAAASSVLSLDLRNDERLHVYGAVGVIGLLVGVSAWLLAVREVWLRIGSTVARGWYLAAVLLLLASLASKPYALGFPIVLVMLDIWPLGRVAGTDVRRLSRSVSEKLPMLAFCALYGVLAAWAKRNAVAPLLLAPEPGWEAKLGQAAYGLGFYVWKTLAPLGLIPFYDRPAEVRLTDARFLAPLLLVPSLTVGVIALRRKLPAALVAGAAYALLVAPTLGIIGFGLQLVADRYCHLASIPLAVATAAVWWHYGWQVDRRRGIASALAVAALVMLAAATSLQVRVWRDSTTLWEHALQWSDSPRALANAALADSESALRDANSRDMLLARACARAQRAVETGVERRLYFPKLRVTYGTILLNAGRLDDARRELTCALQESSDDAQGWVNLGLIELRSERYAEARDALRSGLRLSPGDPSAWRILGFAYEGLRDRRRAAEAYAHSLQLLPGQPVVIDRLRALQRDS